MHRVLLVLVLTLAACNDSETCLEAAKRQITLPIVVQGSLTGVDPAPFDCAGGGPVVIEGSLALDGVDLDPYRCVAAVGGDLTVVNVASLEGLGAVETVCGEVWIGDAPELSNLDGLSSLTRAGGLTVSNAARLTSLEGLSHLTRVEGSLEITGVPLLAKLAGLGALETIADSLTVSDAPMLFSLEGLGRLREIGRNLGIYAPIATFAGLEDLERIGGGLNLETYPTTSAEGLESLEEVGNLWVNDTCVLPDLRGLDHVRSVGWLTVDGGTTSLTGLGGVQTVGGDLTVSGEERTSVSGLSSLESVGGSLTIRDTSIVSLEGLESLRTVGEASEGVGPGDLEISGNASLVSLEALSALTSVYSDFVLLDNEALPSVQGLGALSSIGGNVWIRGEALVDLDGFDALERVGGDFRLEGNTRFEGLIGLERIGGSLIPDLQQDCGGLEALAVIDESLYLNATSSLTSLDGLEALTTIGMLYIDNAHQLQNVDALANLRGVGGSFWIFGNESLMSYTPLHGVQSVGGDLYVVLNGDRSVAEAQALVDAIGRENIGGAVDIEP